MILRILINVPFAVILYLGNGIIGKWKSGSNSLFSYASFSFEDVDTTNFAGNFFHKIVHPAVFLALASAVLQYFSLQCIAEELWLVVPFYWLFRLIHILMWDLLYLINWKYEVTSFIVSMLLGEGTLFFIIRPLFAIGEPIFIDIKQFRDAFWFAVLTYLASLIWNIAKGSLAGQNVFPVEKRSKIITKRYNKFKKKYDVFINHILNESYEFNLKADRERFCFLLYAIMIYEDHCRPVVIRCLEYLVKLIHRNYVMSLGIMQVQTQEFIDNKKSIERAISILYTTYSTANDTDRLELTIKGYNPSYNYICEVLAIYEVLLMMHNF